MQHGIAAVAVTAALPARRALGDPARGPHAPLCVAYDDASADGPAFAAAAAARGARVAYLGPDPGSFWMSTLEPRLERGPVAIAGLTAGAPLFCLEYLARDHGLELVYRIEHSTTASGRVRHVLTGPAELAPRVAELGAAGSGWPAAAGALAAARPAAGARPARIELLDLAGRTTASAVYSWLLAPRPGRRARTRGAGGGKAPGRA